MIVIVSAEPFSNAIRDYGENIFIEKSQTSITDSTWDLLQEWNNEYQKYVAMTLKELEPHWDKIDLLDRKGIEIVKRISSEWFPSNVEKFYYMSMCRDLQYYLYQNGKEKYITTTNI